MMSIEEIENIIEKSEYDVYGIRADYKVYSAGDACEKSHQLMDDTQYDENGDVIDYPITEDGLYDLGELSGTCAILVDENVEEALEKAKNYNCGEHIELIAGYYSECGNDPEEVIIENAVVLMVIK